MEGPRYFLMSSTVSVCPVLDVAPPLNISALGKHNTSKHTVHTERNVRAVLMKGTGEQKDVQSDTLNTHT